MVEPCEECGTPRWLQRVARFFYQRHWIKRGERQWGWRILGWCWKNVMAELAQNSGFRKIYKRWAIYGPVEYRRFTPWAEIKARSANGGLHAEKGA